MSETQETQAPESQPSQDAALQSDSALVARTAQLGLLLRKAREARGLRIDDVVQVLKFSHRQIEALEAGDMASLPGSVFVRGSIRSYARFLKLDPEPLLALLVADIPVAQPEVRPPDNMGNAMDHAGVRQVSPLVAFSVLLLIAAAGIIGWHLLGDRFLQDRAWPLVFDAATTKAVEPTSAMPGPSPQSVVEPADTSVTTTQAPAPVFMQADVRTLEFSFHGKCWVEVRDASQQIIFTGQFEQGARQSVSGQPPFQVVLGNAGSVDLAYEGQTVDLKPHTRAEVARLTLE